MCEGVRYNISISNIKKFEFKYQTYSLLKLMMVLIFPLNITELLSFSRKSEIVFHFKMYLKQCECETMYVKPEPFTGWLFNVYLGAKKVHVIVCSFANINQCCTFPLNLIKFNMSHYFSVAKQF